MEITRRSILSGETRTKVLNITSEQIADYNSGTLVQNAFPNLTPSEREFFMTGITDKEWDELLLEEEEKYE